MGLGNQIMKYLFFVAGLVIIISIGVSCYLGQVSDMSGTYIGKNGDQAYLVQIVQGQGGQLSGFYEESGLSPDGASVTQDNLPLTGHRDGRNFTVASQPDGLAHFVGDSFSLSGIYTGPSIVLNGLDNGFPANLNLLKGSPTNYANYVAELNAQAQAIQNLREKHAEAR
jgi:hypothetical protein